MVKIPISYFFRFLFWTLWLPGFTGLAENFHPFIENKGQWPEDARFMAEVPGGYMWICQKSFRTKLAPIHSGHGPYEKSPFPMKNRWAGHAYEMEFADAEKGIIHPEGDAGPTRYNFFLGNNPKSWATGVQSFTGLRIANLYPGTEVRLYREGGSLKYDLILSAGYRVSRIRLRYSGINGIRLVNGRLKLKTTSGEIEESIPYAYQLVNGFRKRIECRFHLSGNEVSFRFPNGYSPELPLVIDPRFVFYTYSGGTSDNWGNTAIGDADGNSYQAGTVYGPSYPVSLGAFDTTFNGTSPFQSSYDLGIQKFNPTGSTLLVSTFLGGNGADTPHSLNLDANQNLLILGTTSSQNFPVSANAFQPVFGGGDPFSPLSGLSPNYRYGQGSDLFVVKLRSDGNALLASTYLGGTENDGIVAHFDSLSRNYGDAYRGDITTAPDGSVLVASHSFSPDFPVQGAMQAEKAGGMDGVVVRLRPDLSGLIWSTFLGGSGSDALFSIQLQSNDRLVVCGGTKSRDYPVSQNAYQTTMTGNNVNRIGFTDAAVACLSLQSGILLHATYSGTPQYDQAFLVQTDDGGNVYIFGQTDGTMPKTPGVFGNPGGKVFLQKFNPTLENLIWGTTLGEFSFSTLVPSAFMVDTCERIYLSGWGGDSNFGSGSTDGFPVTPDAYKATTDGSDFYFCVLGPDANNLAYATFFGGAFRAEHVDGGMSRFDRTGVITQATCGCKAGTQFFSGSLGSYSPSIQSDNCNQGVVRFDMGILQAGFEISSELKCGKEVVFRNRSTNGIRYSWFWGDGDSLSSNQTQVSHLYTQPGTYIISLKAYNPGTCKKTDIFRDTIILENPFPFPSDTLVEEGCRVAAFQPASVNYPGITRVWFPDPDIVNGDLLNPIILPTPGKVYRISNETEDGCIQWSYFVFRQKAGPGLFFEDSFDLRPCESQGYVVLKGGSQAATGLKWRIGDRDFTGARIRMELDTKRTLEVFLTGQLGSCVDTIWKKLDIPPFDFRVLPEFSNREEVESCSEKTIQFTNQSLNADSFQWDFGDGNISSALNPKHTYRIPGSYKVRLSARNEKCVSEVTRWIPFEPVLVPNFLTKNGDGKNERLILKGIGTGVSIEIYNRWGNKVFSTPSYQNDWTPNSGEEGTYFMVIQFPDGNQCRTWIQVNP